MCIKKNRKEASEELISCRYVYNAQTEEVEKKTQDEKQKTGMKGESESKDRKRVKYGGKTTVDKDSQVSHA